MPTAPPSRCTTPSCTQLTTHGRCTDHTRRPWEHRPDTTWATGSTRAWRRTRAQQLTREPNCRGWPHPCGQPATQVDHIVPLTAGGALHDRANLQSLCDDCHNAKTRDDRTRYR